MMKNCVKRPIIYLVPMVALLAGCGVFPATTKPDIPAPVKLAYQHALGSMKAGKFKQAIAQFNEIVKFNPNLAGPYTNLGIIYLKINALEQAELSLQKAIELNPANVIGYNYLGIVYRQLGFFDKAESAYVRALEIDNNYAYAHLNLGILYDLYKSDMPKALAHYQKYQSLSVDPDKIVEKWIIDIKRRDTARHKVEEKQG